jgi:topoisomerase-4 subunit B
MSYDADSIVSLKGLDPVKVRPGMYTQTDRPNHLAQEAIDNSVDEALGGYANRIKITLHSDSKLEIEDNGRGMPVDINKDEGITGVELIMTKLHAGGKFNKETYSGFSGGLHGVGVSVLNALSERVDVYVKREGKEYHIAFEDGDKVSELSVVREVKGHGTRLSFTPNPKYFDSDKFSVSRLIRVLKSKAILCPGLNVSFINKTDNTEEHWCFPNGQLDYFNTQINEYDTLPVERTLEFKEVGSDFEIHASVRWTPENSSVLSESYVNLIPTIHGGNHVKALKDGLLDAFREFCEHQGLLDKNLKITSEDVSDRLNYLVNFKLAEPSFAGQTKEKLSSSNFMQELRSVIRDKMYEDLTHNREEGIQLAEMVISNARFRQNSKKKIVRKKIITGLMLPGKLADCKSNSLDETEIFFVEGDSAGGSAKQARNRETQAIMPLRGKILNTWELENSDVMASKEVADICQAIGVYPGNEDLTGLRYGKVCILADADSDGLHIAVLFCALFFKHFPALVKAGHLYVSVPPLYRIDLGKEVFYAQDEAHKVRILNKLAKKKGQVSVQRFKGLGEMNPDQLEETTMNPEKRTLLQLVTEDFEFETQIIDMLLAKSKADKRKQWLEDRGALSGAAKESNGGA